MANEKLPIKFFAKREIDELRTEGGGGDPPRWVLSGNKLKEKATQLSLDLGRFQEQVAKKQVKKSTIPFVFKAKISKDAIAKSHRHEITNFLSDRNDNIIAMTQNDELIIKIDSSKELKAISNKLGKYEQNKYAISCLEEFIDYEPQSIIDDSEKLTNYKVKLLDFQEYEENQAIQAQFEKHILENKLNYKKTKYTETVTIYNIKNINASTLDSLKNSNSELFNAIFSIEPMPQYTVNLDFMENEQVITIMKPDAAKRYATIGVLDSGIKTIPHLKPWLLDDNYSAYPDTHIDPSHGTFVAGVALYGDMSENQHWTGTNGFKLFDATVFPRKDKETINEDDLISNIREAIAQKHSEVKIWNLSISINNLVSDNEFSDFAVALDDLQDKYNILICKSAGNCSNFMNVQPKGRIVHGADSVRSLVVGSIAHKKNEFDIANVDNPSPFTRIGPGPAYIVKPDVIHYGGNAGVDNNNNACYSGVKSFNANGKTACSVGTSFSTPRITSLAAGIYQELEEDFDPLFIKALIVHSAHYPSSLDLPDNEKIKQLGFGKPKPITEVLYNSPNEATLILRDNLAKGEYIDIMDFPMPDCLIKDGFFTGQIIATLVFDPILEPSQANEYCQSNVSVKIGTYDKKIKRDTTKRHILNELGKEEPKNILLESLYSKRAIKNLSNDFATKERMLIQYGDKYHPIKKYAVDLSEITEANKNRYLTANKKWFLSINGIYRNFIEKKAQKESRDLNQEFCLMITIKDPTGKSNVYDKVAQKLDEYNFWHSNVKISTDVDISI